MRSEYTRNLSRGQTLYKDQRFEEALGYFKKALMLKPYSHVAWNEKGNALRKLGRQEEAMDCYERAIQLDKKRSYPFPYVGIADMYRGQEQYQAAILYYDKALGIRRHPWALNGKGICLLARNQADEALELAEEAIRIRPEFLFPYILKGDILSERAAYRDALGSYRKAFDLIRAPSPELRGEVENKIARCIEMLGRGSPVGPDNSDHSGIDLLFALLRSEEGRDRIHASYQLDIMAKGGEAGQIVQKRPFNALIGALGDAVPDVRRNTLWIIGNLALQGYSYEVAGSGVLPEAAARLDDPADMVRSAAAWSLAMVAEAGQGIAVADSGATTCCIRLLKNKNVELQACAALALDKIAFYASPEPVVRNGGTIALAGRLNAKDDGVRTCALWALWSIACRGYADSLCYADTLVTDLKQCAQDRDRDIRRAAVSIIGELSNVSDKSFLQQKDLEKILLTCIGSESKRVRGAAIWAAGQWMDGDHANVLLQAGVKEAIRDHLDDGAGVYVFDHSEHRWKQRSIGGVANEVLKKIAAPPEPPSPGPAPCRPDYRTAYFVAQNLVNHLRWGDLLEARKSVVHLEGFVCGGILERVHCIRERLLFQIKVGIDEVPGGFADEVDMLKEDILREAMR
jgi:tetratricopeptide (TPR) repeat protein